MQFQRVIVDLAFHRRDHRVSSSWPSPTRTPATDSEDTAVILDYILGSALSVVLIGYLVYALLRPEKF